jgi:hypothetical protein
MPVATTAADASAKARANRPLKPYLPEHRPGQQQRRGMLLVGQAHGVVPVLGPELRDDLGHVILCCAERYAQPLGDLFVRKALPYQGKDLPLSRRQTIWLLVTSSHSVRDLLYSLSRAFALSEVTF